MADSTDSTTGLFQRVFRGLEEDVLAELRKFATRKRYPAGYTLCRQGEREHTFYVVAKGRVVATQKLEDGEERMLGVRGPNEYFGEIGLLDNAPRMATVTTLVPTSVFEVTEEVFDHLVVESPAIAYTISRTILETLRTLDQHAIEDLEAKNQALRLAYEELQAAHEALVEKQRLERELEIAAEVQRSLLPAELPSYHDYRHAAYLEPARQVGGDFYDVFELDDDHLGIVIADVADKSIQAALFMAVSRTLFLVESKRTLSPARVAKAVHRGFIAVSPVAESFVTAFYGVLHRASGKLTYVIAGHERPLLARPGEGIVTLRGKGRFLGMMEQLELEEFSVVLQSGDRLVLFSDGVPDAENPQGENYGVGRLRDILKNVSHQDAQQVVRAIKNDIAAWRQDAVPVDDLTLLVVEVR